MKITVNNAVDGIVAFLSSEASKIPKLSDRFLMYAALGASKANPDGVIGSFMPMLHKAGIVDSDGMVNVDAVQEGLAMAFANVPSFSMLGFTFTEEDVPVLMRHLAKAGG